MSHLRPFLIAAQFLTRAPLPRLAAPAPAETGRSVLYYPAVGLMLGVALALLAAISAARVPPMLAAALILAAWVAATGGLHLDGLADSADAWACGGDRERKLAVMKDPNCGPAAVSTLTVTLLLKFAALTALIAASNWSAIALSPMLGRAGPLAVLLTTPYVRAGGLGEAMAAHLPRGAGWAVIAVTLAAALACGHVAMSIGGVAMLALLRHLMMRHLGGATGDTIGASVELTEAAALVAAAFAH